MKALTPLLLIGLAIGLFFWYINPQYQKVKVLRNEKVSLEKKIDEAKDAEKLKTQLLATYNTFSDADLEKLRKFIPDNPDNIALIMNINTIASKFGSSIMSIKADEPATAAGPVTSDRPYMTHNMSFTVTMPYDRFIDFLEELQVNLRLIDVTSINFKPAEGNSYEFSVGIKAYWLK